MPNYDYLCSECEHLFDKILRIDDRYVPETEACPSCGELTIRLVMLGAPAMGDAVRLRVRRPDNGFREVLQKIHEKTPGSILKNNSSFI